MIAEPQRILIVALGNLGDLVFSSALAAPLHAAYPDARIDVWCKAYSAPVAPLIPHVSEVIAADPFWAIQPHIGRQPMARFLSSMVRVRRARYDIAVMSDAPWRTAAAVAATGIPVRIGHERHRNRRFLTHVVAAESPLLPVVQEQARLLEPLGVPPGHIRYRLDASRAGPLRRSIINQLPRNVAALHPFAGSRARCVPVRQWMDLSRALESRGYGILWVGSEPELNELRAVPGHRASAYTDRLAGGSLAAAAAALSAASVFVGHDSGPLHVAAALGVPTVGIFAPGQPDRTFPQGTGPYRVIHRDVPADIGASEMLREIETFRLVSGA